MIAPITANFTPFPFAETLPRATSPDKVAEYVNYGEAIMEWMLLKFKDDEADNNTFKAFIAQLQASISQQNALADILNALAGATAKASWNNADDFAGTVVPHNDMLFLCLVNPCVDSEPTETNTDWFVIYKETRTQNLTVVMDNTKQSGTTINFLENTFTPTRDGEILLEVVANVGVDTYSDAITLKIHKDGVAVGNGFYSKYAYSYSSYSGYMMHPYTFFEKITVEKGVPIVLKAVHTGQSDTYINRANNSVSYGTAYSVMKIIEL